MVLTILCTTKSRRPPTVRECDKEATGEWVYISAWSYGLWTARFKTCVSVCVDVLVTQLSRRSPAGNKAFITQMFAREIGRA